LYKIKYIAGTVSKNKIGVFHSATEEGEVMGLGIMYVSLYISAPLWL
jgi:hypothetical protein